MRSFGKCRLSRPGTRHERSSIGYERTTPRGHPVETSAEVVHQRFFSENPQGLAEVGTFAAPIRRYGLNTQKWLGCPANSTGGASISACTNAR